MIPHSFTEVLPWLLPLVFYYFLRVVVLTALLWGMLRAQELNYNIPGLLGSAALASACDIIPFGGHALAVGVLIFCMIKVTGAHFTDVKFTVVISYAVMFLIQMVLLSVVPMEVPAHARNNPSVQAFLDHIDGKEAADAGVLPQNPAKDTNQVPALVVSTVTNTNTTKPVPSKAAAPKESTTKTALSSPPSEKSPAALAEMFSLKGVMSNAQSPMAFIKVGTKTYTLQLGETVSVTTAHGALDVTLEQVTQDGAVLKVGGTRVSLRMR